MCGYVGVCKGGSIMKMKPNDPAYWMLFDEFETKLVTHNKNCYICNDNEYARMGLPLCYECIICGAHVPADDIVCDNGHQQPTSPDEELEIRIQYKLEIPQSLLDLNDDKN